MATLTYFDGRGRAELIRLLLAKAGITFTEKFLEEKSDIEKLREDGTLEFQQVPLLEIDGLKLVQTGAILRYIARKAGMYGTNDTEATLIDMYFEATKDFQIAFLPLGFMRTPEEILADAKKSSISRYLPAFEKIKRIYHHFVQRQRNLTRVSKDLQCTTRLAESLMLQIFDTRRLASNDTGFLVGSAVSLADVALLEPLLNIDEFLGKDILDEFPQVKAFYERMLAIESIASFLNGPQRKKANDEKYVTTVKRVLYN